MDTKKESYRKAFSFGKREHVLERWTNICLIVTLIVFLIGFYFRCWFFMYFALGWICITIVVHLCARCCHNYEKKWHKKANVKDRWFH